MSLAKLKMSVRKGKAFPKFADADLERRLSDARDRFEQRLGTALSEFDEDELSGCFSDKKTAETALSVLGRYYSFRARNLGDLFSGGERSLLSSAGIESCVDLRLKFFEHLSRNHSGFMSSESRDQLLEEFAEQVSVDRARLDEALWLDDEDMKVLVRLADRVPTELGATYDFEVVSSILLNSYHLRLGPIGDGQVAKFIFRGSKLYGLLFEVSAEKEGLVFRIDGPMALFSKPGKHGYRLALLMYRLRQLHGRKPFECPFSIEFRKSRKKVAYEGQISDIPTLEWPNVGELKLQLFDSKVEAKVFSTFKTMDMKGWRIEREPEPIPLDGSVFIPDFRLRRGEDEVLFEVIGFWMPEYKKHKKAVLQSLDRAGVKNLLILVDEKAEDDFRGITKAPLFAYRRSGSSYRIPYSRILGYLESRYPWTPEARPAEKGSEPTIVEHGEGKYKVFW